MLHLHFIFLILYCTSLVHCSDSEVLNSSLLTQSDPDGCSTLNDCFNCTFSAKCSWKNKKCLENRNIPLVYNQITLIEFFEKSK